MKKILLFCMITFAHVCFARPTLNRLVIEAPSNLSEENKNEFQYNLEQFNALLANNDFSNAMKYLDKIIRTSFHNCSLWIWRACLNYAMKKYNKSIDDCEQALDLSPSQNEIAELYYLKSNNYFALASECWLYQSRVDYQSKAETALIVAAKSGHRKAQEKLIALDIQKRKEAEDRIKDAENARSFATQLALMNYMNASVQNY